MSDSETSELAPVEVPVTRKVKINTFLTEEEIALCCVLYPDRKRIRDEIIRPNMETINRKLGVESDADYISFMIIAVLTKAASRHNA
jgi:hypothetical protein